MNIQRGELTNILRKVHLAGWRLYQHKKMPSSLQNINLEMYFEFNTIKKLQGMPSNCPWGQKYDLNQVMNCKIGGFVVMRHNNVRDFEANLLKTIQSDVEIEPALQKVDNRRINERRGDKARPDIWAWEVCQQMPNAFFDIRLANVNHNSQKKVKLLRQYWKNTKKKRKWLTIVTLWMWNMGCSLHSVGSF